jgi:F-type H+-transporting ATPase subunit gamma
VLHAVIRELSALQQDLGAPEVSCVYHAGDDGLARQALLPPFVSIATGPFRHAIPPVLNQSPGELFAELTDHYLFAVLHKVMYASLMAENQRRIAHLDCAIEHLDDESAELARRCNALRQEEIINEIEMILLSAASLGET